MATGIALYTQNATTQFLEFDRLQPPANVLLYLDGGPGSAYGMCSPPRQYPSAVPLQAMHRLPQPHILLPAYKHPDLTLHDDATPAQFVAAQLLQIGHLAGPEEYLRFTKLILIRRLDVVLEYILARSLHIVPIDVGKLAQHAVPLKKLQVRPATGETGGGQSNRFQYTARP